MGCREEGCDARLVRAGSLSLTPGPVLKAFAVLGLVLIISSCSASDDPPNREAPSPDARIDIRRYGPGRALGAFDDRAIVESSGVVASRRSPGVLWTHNDSGGEPELFCVRLDGSSCGSVVVAGAEAIDWEDIAAAGSDLFVGDIGDNTRDRETLTVYRVPEPEPPGPGRTIHTESSDPIALRYPRAVHDAEALLVHPRTRAFYIVTKGSPALVYRAGPSGGRLKLVGVLRLPGLVSFATGGDIAPDGRHVAIGTYGPAFELSVDEGVRFDRLWSDEALRVALPFARQREAIAYRHDGRALIVTSEGAGAAILEVELKR